MLFLYFDVFKILVFSCLGFEGGIRVLIAPVPGHCVFVTFAVRILCSLPICILGISSFYFDFGFDLTSF